jgi:hypothetical protein
VPGAYGSKVPRAALYRAGGLRYRVPGRFALPCWGLRSTVLGACAVRCRGLTAQGAGRFASKCRGLCSTVLEDLRARVPTARPRTFAGHLRRTLRR